MAVRLELEVITSSTEAETYQFLANREIAQGVDHHNPCYWRRRDAICYGRGWIWRRETDKAIVGITTLPVITEHNEAEASKGFLTFDLADLDLLPPNLGLHCLAQTIIIVETALTLAMYAPVKLLTTRCPPSNPARPALLGLGAYAPADAPSMLYLLPDVIAAASRELKKHIGLVSTTTQGRLGNAHVNMSKAGMLFGIGHQATISRFARGDLSAIGHNTVPFQQEIHDETKVCAA